MAKTKHLASTTCTFLIEELYLKHKAVKKNCGITLSAQYLFVYQWPQHHSDWQPSVSGQTGLMSSFFLLVHQVSFQSLHVSLSVLQHCPSYPKNNKG